MLVSGIKSRPQYATLKPDSFATCHLVTAEGAGVDAVAEMLNGAGQEILARTTILYVRSGPSAKQISSLAVDRAQVFPTVETLLIRLDGYLSIATMGTRLYVAGIEGFIGQVIQRAESHGIDHRSVVTEHRGSSVRRIQCVHCKGITENVTANVAPCSHCGINLLVRDHYSRRLGAFMAVSADAEAPGELPPVQEIFR